ncbi:MAG: arginase [Clostridium sp.]|nr:arginase [Clostridium sp.]
MVVDLIGVPIFYGSDRKGVDFGPNKLRENNIVDIIRKNNHEVYDLGNIYVPKVDEKDKFAWDSNMKYLYPIVDVDTNLAEEVYNSLNSGRFPFVIGGDHSLGLGSIAGASKYNKDIAVIWVDAHGDINTNNTSNTGNVHGMPLAAAMGFGSRKLTDLYYKGTKVNPKNVFILGARDLDEKEKELAKDTDLNIYSTKDIKTKGILAILNEIDATLKKNNINAMHLSFDIDSIDPSVIPGTGTPVSNGINIDEAKSIIKFFMQTNMVKSMDLVELNTLLDKNDITTKNVLGLVDDVFKYSK